MGLHQLSAERFAFAVHEQGSASAAVHEFDAGALRMALVQHAEGGAGAVSQGMPSEVARARDALFERMHRDPDCGVTGAVMSLRSASDSWHMTVLPKDSPGWHVALAFSFFPLPIVVSEQGLVHLSYSRSPAAVPYAAPGWNLLHPAVAQQAAAIVLPDAHSAAEGIARLAGRPGLVSYLLGMGDTFSLSDVEQLARTGQTTASIVLALASGLQGEDRTWMYQVRLSERALSQAGQFALVYARAKSHHLEALARHPARDGLDRHQLEIREAHIVRFAHHLALLQLCAEFGIGLWSCPMSAAQNYQPYAGDVDPLASGWAEAVPLEAASYEKRLDAHL